MTKVAVIPVWMPESSAMDGNLDTSQEFDLIQSFRQNNQIPGHQ
jgi:hypothetical protein